MKIQKRLSRKYKEKKYYKYLITLPEQEIKKSGLKEGDEVEIISKKNEIKLVKI